MRTRLRRNAGDGARAREGRDDGDDGDGDGDGEEDGDERERARERARRAVHARTYDAMDRDFACELAEMSHARAKRASGDEWFYGELTYDDGARVARRLARVECDEKAEREFVDLGSGLGKMVTCAALTGVFARARGIELLPELHERATAALETYRASVDRAIAPCDVELVLGNLLTFDVSKADVIYIHATCFTPGLLNATATKLASECKAGARVLIVSKQLPEGWVFAPFDGGYVALAQPQTHWKLDGWMYEVRRS